MDRKIAAALSVITLIVLALAITLPGGRTIDKPTKLPWQIQLDAEGFPTVLGVTLGKSHLNDARTSFNSEGKTNLFRSDNGTLVVESFFQRVFLNGLRADIVLVYDLDEALLTQMYERGLRISQMGSGGKRVELSEEDMQRIEKTVIDHITYIPGTDLDEELLRDRFGLPDQIIEEPSGISHWLYPEKGLDIAVSREDKEVFQYLIPAKFQLAQAPLAPKQPAAAQ